MNVRAGVVLSVLLLCTGCASLPSASGEIKPGMFLGDLQPATGTRSVARDQDDRGPHDLASPPRNGVVRGAQQGASLTRWATLRAIDDLKGSTAGIASALARLEARRKSGTGVGWPHGVFSGYVAFGSRQLPSLQHALADSSVLVDAAAGVADADMELALLRMAGPRIEAAMFEAILLATWVDFLNLADVVLLRRPAHGVETLFVEMNRVQRLMESSVAALGSENPEQVEAAALAVPDLMGQLTHEYALIHERVRRTAENTAKGMVVVQLIEMATMISALKMSLPRLLPPPPAAPVALGATLAMGSGGVMAGSQIVVSAEWVEMVRRLVQAGVISLPAVSAAVRIHAGQVMMAQANGDLPQGVRDALGDGPEVRGMHETGKAGAGMSEAPRHHVLPEEHRAWFEQRGFRGDLEIDRFCVRLEQAHHQAVHGGGNWRLGRTWPGEWSRMIMKTLREAETEASRMLTRNEILNIVAERMKRYDIQMNFIPGRRR